MSKPRATPKPGLTMISGICAECNLYISQTMPDTPWYHSDTGNELCGIILTPLAE